MSHEVTDARSAMIGLHILAEFMRRQAHRLSSIHPECVTPIVAAATCKRLVANVAEIDACLSMLPLDEDGNQMVAEHVAELAALEAKYPRGGNVATCQDGEG